MPCDGVSRFLFGWTEVEYSEDLLDPKHSPLDRLPPHVEALRKGILDFQGLIPDSYRDEIEEENTASLELTGASGAVAAPDNAYFTLAQAPRRLSAQKLDDFEKDYRESEIVSQKVQRLLKHPTSPSEWQFLLRLHICQPFEEGASETNASVSSQWALEMNLKWNDIQKDPDIFRRLPGPDGEPTPQFTYGFPIRESLDDLPVILQGAGNEVNFSADSLGDLRQAGLRSTPTDGLHKWTPQKNTSLSRAHRLCFPYATVHIEDDDDPRPVESTAVISGACTGANALRTVQDLAAYSHSQRFGGSGTSSRDTLPAFVLCILSKSMMRVCLCYKQPGKDRYAIECIWMGTLASKWGVLATRRIVNNMLTWALHVLRPQISGWITDARSRLLNPPAATSAFNMFSVGKLSFDFNQPSKQQDKGPAPRPSSAVIRQRKRSKPAQYNAEWAVRFGNVVRVPWRGKTIYIRLPQNDNRQPLKREIDGGGKKDGSGDHSHLKVGTRQGRQGAGNAGISKPL